MEELKKQDLPANTKVWREDMDYWVEASDLEELKGHNPQGTAAYYAI